MRPSSSTRRTVRALAAAASVFVLASGCAAMVRTWTFHAPPTDAGPLRIDVKDAQVTQKSAYVTLALTNADSAPHRLAVATFTMTLDDGTEVLGKTSFLGRTFASAKSTLSKWGIMDEEKAPELAPGASTEVKIAFRLANRDLRRHPTLSIATSALVVDGKPLEAPPVVLEAPPEAPMGEDI